MFINKFIENAEKKLSKHVCHNKVARRLGTGNKTANVNVKKLQ